MGIVALLDLFSWETEAELNAVSILQYQLLQRPYLNSLLTNPDLSVSMFGDDPELESMLDESDEFADIWEKLMDKVSEYEEFRVAYGC